MSLPQPTATPAAEASSGRPKKFGRRATRAAIPAVNGSLYAARTKIQPQSLSGIMMFSDRAFGS